MPEALGLSRSRLTRLIREGAVRDAASGAALLDPKERPKSDQTLVVTLPEPEDMALEPEAIPLSVVHEDASLLVVDKPAGLVVHPGAGVHSGTLVNALLNHCGETLSGIGGERRPGIVHRIDKDTTGLLVVAKSDVAHQGLSRQFEDHSARRRYVAYCWGVPDRANARLGGMSVTQFEPDGTLVINAPLGRHPTDRTRMAVVAKGRHAVTRAAVTDRFSTVAAGITCRLETGRTHQIRVHLAQLGHSLIGDQVYGRPRKLPSTVGGAQADLILSFPRQALHAAELRFTHPVSGEDMLFEAPLPADMTALGAALKAAFG